MICPYCSAAAHTAKQVSVLVPTADLGKDSVYRCGTMIVGGVTVRSKYCMVREESK